MHLKYCKDVAREFAAISCRPSKIHDCIQFLGHHCRSGDPLRSVSLVVVRHHLNVFSFFSETLFLVSSIYRERWTFFANSLPPQWPLWGKTCKFFYNPFYLLRTIQQINLVRICLDRDPNTESSLLTAI